MFFQAPDEILHLFASRRRNPTPYVECYYGRSLTDVCIGRICGLNDGICEVGTTLVKRSPSTADSPPAGPSCLTAIRANYSALTKAEKKVADFVRSNPEDAYYASGLELAARTGVSEATVVRFWRSIGYSTSMEFKLSLSRDLARASSGRSSGDVSLLDSVSSMIQKLSDRAIGSIRATEELLNEAEMEKAIDMLLGSRKVCLFGVGLSGCVAGYARNNFLRIGIQCETDGDSHTQSMIASALGRQDVALGISYSGTTRETIHCLTLAMQAGAGTICITSFAQSPITEVADVSLIAVTRESELLNAATKSQLAQVHILDLLCCGVAMKKYDQAVDSAEKIMQAVTGMRML